MDFQKYKTNLTSQLTAVNADIVEKEEELEKLREFRSRVKGGLEVVNNGNDMNTLLHHHHSNSNRTFVRLLKNWYRVNCQGFIGVYG